MGLNLCSESVGASNFEILIEDSYTGSPSSITVIMNFVWKTDEGEAESTVLLIFVLWRCYNCRRVDKVCRDLCSVDHAKTCNCFSKICKVQIEFFTNIQMTRNSEKKNKQILR